MNATQRRFGLDESVIAMLCNIFARYPEITDVRVLESRAVGNFRPGSDIDLSIMDKKLSGDQFLHLQNDMDESPTPYTVDLVRFHTIENADLTGHILRVGKLFYQA